MPSGNLCHQRSALTTLSVLLRPTLMERRFFRQNRQMCLLCVCLAHASLGRAERPTSSSSYRNTRTTQGRPGTDEEAEAGAYAQTKRTASTPVYTQICAWIINALFFSLFPSAAREAKVNWGGEIRRMLPSKLVKSVHISAETCPALCGVMYTKQAHMTSR